MPREQDPNGPLVNDPTDGPMVCMHCGSGDIFAEVTVSGWIGGAVFVGDDGKPHFETKGRPEVDSYEYDLDRYVCNACRREEYRLEQLVIPAPAEGDMPIAACGRCDHGRAEHPERGSMLTRKIGFERGPMPCTHKGCDCHDYYDRSVAEAGQPADVLAAIRRAA